MKNLLLKVFLLKIFLVFNFATSVHAVPFPSLHVALDDPMLNHIYNFTDYMLVKYSIFPFHQNIRPYTHLKLKTVLKSFKEKNLSILERKMVVSYLDYLNNIKSLANYQVNESQFSLDLESGFYFTSKNQPMGKSGNEIGLQIRPILNGQLGNGLSFSTDLRFFFITGQNFQDTIRTEVEVEQIGEDAFDTAGLAPAYIQLNLLGFDLLIGKQNLSWGPGRYGNLLLSDHSIPMEMIYLRGEYSKIAFQAFQAIGQSSFGNKILSGHRIDLNLFPRLSLGISEIIVIGADKFDPRFLNPVSIYTISEISGGGILNSNVKTSLGNLLISGDFDLKIFDNIRVYMEVMIDDFQPRYRLQSHLHWGSKWGVLAGLQMIDIFSLNGTNISFEYAFLNQYTYTHNTPINAYTHLGRPIGHHIGPDAQSIWFEVRHHWTSLFATEISFELQHQGQQNINVPRDYKRPADEKWHCLSGTEEIQKHFRLTSRFDNYGSLLLEATYALTHVENVKHLFQQQSNLHELSFLSLYRF